MQLQIGPSSSPSKFESVRNNHVKVTSSHLIQTFNQGKKTFKNNYLIVFEARQHFKTQPELYVTPFHCLTQLMYICTQI